MDRPDPSDAVNVFTMVASTLKSLLSLGVLASLVSCDGNWHKTLHNVSDSTEQVFGIPAFPGYVGREFRDTVYAGKSGKVCFLKPDSSVIIGYTSGWWGDSEDMNFSELEVRSTRDTVRYSSRNDIYLAGNRGKYESVIDVK